MRRVVTGEGLSVKGDPSLMECHPEEKEHKFGKQKRVGLMRSFGLCVLETGSSVRLVIFSLGLEPAGPAC